VSESHESHDQARDRLYRDNPLSDLDDAAWHGDPDYSPYVRDELGAIRRLLASPSPDNHLAAKRRVEDLLPHPMARQQRIRVWATLGNCVTELREYDAATRAFGAAMLLTTFPTSVSVRSDKATAEATIMTIELALLSARADYLAGNFTLAYELFEIILDSFGDLPPVARTPRMIAMQARIHTYLADALCLLARIDDAKASLARADVLYQQITRRPAQTDEGAQAKRSSGWQADEETRLRITLAQIRGERASGASDSHSEHIARVNCAAEVAFDAERLGDIPLHGAAIIECAAEYEAFGAPGVAMQCYQLALATLGNTSPIYALAAQRGVARLKHAPAHSG
jgi:hypothetical protein